MSWAFNDKHMPSAHHPNPRDVGICGQGGGCPALGSSCRRNFWWGRYLPVPGTGERPAGLQSAGRRRAAFGSCSISGYLSSVSSPLAPRLPAVSWVGVGAGAGPPARSRDGGCRPCSLPGALHRPLPRPAPHLVAAPAFPAFTLRASQQPLAAPHPPRCSDLANRARRCRSRARPQERHLHLTLSL